MTALHFAAQKGSNPVVQFLADHGATLDVKDSNNRTPLDVANGVPVPRARYAIASLFKPQLGARKRRTGLRELSWSLP